MMLSMTNRAAVCAAGLMLSGCMQSFPSAEPIMRPTQEAFARLTSWTPWRPQAAPEPIVLQGDEVAPAAAAPAPMRGLPRQTRAKKPPAPAAMARASRLAPDMSRRPALLVPVAATSPDPAAMTTDPLPGRLSCETQNRPGVRVSMRCLPVD